MLIDKKKLVIKIIASLKAPKQTIVSPKKKKKKERKKEESIC
jgi:hypothetical protein